MDDHAMKVIFQRSVAGFGWSFVKGQEYDLTDHVAHRFVRLGFAKPVRVRAAEIMEAATVEPTETATARPVGKRRRKQHEPELDTEPEAESEPETVEDADANTDPEASP